MKLNFGQIKLKQSLAFFVHLFTLFPFDLLNYFFMKYYISIEYGLGADPSTAGDVYSYGIMVLEMMTGKRPIDDVFDEGLNLHTYVRMALADQVVQIVDPRLLENDGYALDNVRNPRQAMTWMTSMVSVTYEDWSGMLHGVTT